MTYQIIVDTKTQPSLLFIFTLKLNIYPFIFFCLSNSGLTCCQVKKYPKPSLISSYNLKEKKTRKEIISEND